MTFNPALTQLMELVQVFQQQIPLSRKIHLATITPTPTTGHTQTRLTHLPLLASTPLINLTEVITKL